MKPGILPLMEQDAKPGTHMSRIGKMATAALLAALGGCATLTEDSTDQIVEVHAVQDNRELAGVGCVLSNKLGRWFVVAPGRITVARTPQPLTVDCAKDGVGRAVEYAQSRYDAHDLIATVLTTGGVGYVMDSYSGAGFAYPPVLTVILPTAQPQREAEVSEAARNRVF
jgi:hypothetical protein